MQIAWTCFFFFLCGVSWTNGQKHVRSFINASKSLSIQELERQIKEMEKDDELDWKNLYLAQYDLLLKGETNQKIQLIDSVGTIIYRSFALMTEADIIKHKEIGLDSLIYNLYRSSLDLAISAKERPLICELSKKLLSIVSQNTLLLSEYPYYLSLYKGSIYDKFEEINANLLSINFDFSQTGKPFLERYLNCLSTIPQTTGFDILRAKNYSMLGRSYDIALGKYEKALKYHRLAKNIYDKYEVFAMREKTFSSMVNIGIIQHFQGLPSRSNNSLKNALKVELRKDKIFNKVMAMNWISKNYEKQNQLDSALIYIRGMIDLQDSLNTLINAKNISYLQTRFKTAEKENQILEEQQKVRANRNWLIAVTLALLLGTGIAVLLQKNTSKKRLLAEQEAILKQQRVENLLKEQELVSIDAMIAGQEKERQKVAGELHDDLGSLMATIKLHFDNAKVSKQDPALQNAQKLLEEAYQKIRGMAHNKHSGVMSDQGLLPAIKKMARTVTDTDALEVTVEDFGLGERMENSLELSIFRIIQELVANVIKHAEASHVTIQLTQHEDNLNIIVEDNGKGFDRSQLKISDSGMGLTTIEKRVEHLEGNFTVDSILGKGTSILIDIPV